MGADLAVYILRSGSYCFNVKFMEVDLYISMGNLCTNDLPYDFTVGNVLCSFFVNNIW